MRMISDADLTPQVAEDDAGNQRAETDEWRRN